MGNDNKIGMKPEVKLFLQNTFFKSNKEQADTYDLETEYAKASKNKDYRTTIIIGILFVLAIGITIGVSKYIDYRNRQITVSVDVFEDVNLKKLLDMVSRTQTDLENAISEKMRNEQDRQNELEAARARNEVDKLALQSLNLASVQLQERMDELDSEYDRQIDEINSRYESLLLDIDTRIGEYQNQLAAYDSNSVETAQKQQAAIDSQRQVYELEKQAIIEKYEAALSELRNKIVQLQEQDIQSQKDYVKQSSQSSQYQKSLYDPIITDIRGDRILASIAGYGQQTYSLDDADPLNDLYPALVKVAAQMSDLEYATAILLNLPQVNSMPEYVKAIKTLAVDAGLHLATEGSRIIAELNDNIDSLTADKEEMQAIIDEGTELINTLNASIQSLTETVADRDEEIAGLEGQLADVTCELAGVSSELSSVSDELAGVSSELSSVSGTLARVSSELDDECEENAILQSYAAYFDSLAFGQGMDGVIAASTDNGFLVYVSPLFASSADGLAAYVYRGTTEYIGEVKITQKNGFLYASVVSSAAGKQIQPSDTLILNISGGRK